MIKKVILSVALFSLSLPGFAREIYTPPSENIKKFFAGTWEGTVNIGLAIPDSEVELESSHILQFGIYHDIGSRMAVEFQYFFTGDFDSEFSAVTSLETSGFSASLRGYGKPGTFNLVYFGRLGISSWSTDFDNGSITTEADSGSSLMLGFGAEKSLNPTTTISTEITYMDQLVQEGALTTFNIGIRKVLFER